MSDTRPSRKCVWLLDSTVVRLERLRLKLAGPTGQKPYWDNVLLWMLDRVQGRV